MSAANAGSVEAKWSGEASVLRPGAGRPFTLHVPELFRPL